MFWISLIIILILIFVLLRNSSRSGSSDSTLNDKRKEYLRWALKDLDDVIAGDTNNAAVTLRDRYRDELKRYEPWVEFVKPAAPPETQPHVQSEDKPILHSVAPTIFARDKVETEEDKPVFDFQNWYADNSINLLLYLGAFLIVASVGTFVGFNWQTFSGATKAALLMLLTLTFFSAGIILYQKFEKLKPAGVTFLTIAAILIPFNGVAWYRFVLAPQGVDFGVVWLITSAIALISYVFFYLYLKKEYFAYIIALSTLSMSESFIRIADLSTTYYIFGAIVTSFILLAFQHAYKKVPQAKETFAFMISAHLLLPVSLLFGLIKLMGDGNVFIIEAAVSLTLAAVFYIVSYQLDKRMEYFVGARIFIMLASLFWPEALHAPVWVTLYTMLATNIVTDLAIIKLLVHEPFHDQMKQASILTGFLVPVGLFFASLAFDVNPIHQFLFAVLIACECLLYYQYYKIAWFLYGTNFALLVACAIYSLDVIDRSYLYVAVFSAILALINYLVVEYLLLKKPDALDGELKQTLLVSYGLLMPAAFLFAIEESSWQIALSLIAAAVTGLQAYRFSQSWLLYLVNALLFYGILRYSFGILDTHETVTASVATMALGLANYAAFEIKRIKLGTVTSSANSIDGVLLASFSFLTAASFWFSISSYRWQLFVVGLIIVVTIRLSYIFKNPALLYLTNIAAFYGFYVYDYQVLEVGKVLHLALCALTIGIVNLGALEYLRKGHQRGASTSLSSFEATYTAMCVVFSALAVVLTSDLTLWHVGIGAVLALQILRLGYHYNAPAVVYASWGLGLYLLFRTLDYYAVPNQYVPLLLSGFAALPFAGFYIISEESWRKHLAWCGLIYATLVALFAFIDYFGDAAYFGITGTSAIHRADLLTAYIASALYFLYAYSMKQRPYWYTALVVGLLTYYWQAYHLDWHNIQYYIIPTALVAFGLGYFYRTRGEVSNEEMIDTASIALLMLPTMYQAFGDGGARYALLMGIEGVILLAAGLSMRYRIYTYGGVIFVVLAVVSQTYAYVLSIPRWIVTLIAGLVFLSVAIFLLQKRGGKHEDHLPSNKGFSTILLLLGGFILVILGAGVYVYVQKSQNFTQMTSLPSPNVEVTNATSYTDSVYGFSIKYPSKYTLVKNAHWIEQKAGFDSFLFQTNGDPPYTPGFSVRKNWTLNDHLEVLKSEKLQIDSVEEIIIGSVPVKKIKYTMEPHASSILLLEKNGLTFIFGNADMYESLYSEVIQSLTP